MSIIVVPLVLLYNKPLKTMSFQVKDKWVYYHAIVMVNYLISSKFKFEFNTFQIISQGNHIPKWLEVM